MLVSMPVHVLRLCIVSGAERTLDPCCFGGSLVVLAQRLMLLQVLSFFNFPSTEPAGDILVSREVYLFMLCEPAQGSKGLFTLITRVGLVSRTMPFFMEGECSLICKVFAAVLALVRGYLQVLGPHVCPKPLSIVALIPTH